MEGTSQSLAENEREGTRREMGAVRGSERVGEWKRGARE